MKRIITLLATAALVLPSAALSYNDDPGIEDAIGSNGQSSTPDIIFDQDTDTSVSGCWEIFFIDRPPIILGCW